MGYLIQHLFDNEYFKQKFVIEPGESEDRIRRERSKSRINFKHPDGTFGEVFTLSADARNKQMAGDALMGFGCIPAGMRIMTEKGNFPIDLLVKEKLSINVLSFDHKNEKIEWKPIKSYQKNPLGQRKIMEITIGNKQFQCTDDHPVFVESKGYIRAKELKIGDKILYAGEM